MGLRGEAAGWLRLAGGFAFVPMLAAYADRAGSATFCEVPRPFLFACEPHEHALFAYFRREEKGWLPKWFE